MQELINKICDYIIKTAQEQANPDMGGFQYIVDHTQISEAFSQQIYETIQTEIMNTLEQREEVADVVCDTDGFDVVLQSDFAPNYNYQEEE